MTLYEKVKDKIVETVPEIMDLKFGCEVIVKGIREDNPHCENDIVVDDRKTKYNTIGLGFFGDVPIKEVEILGRPITLEDVLRALKGREHEYFITIDCDKLATFYEIVCTIGEDGNLQVEGTGIYWQLGKPLSDQSKETINFLNNLLK